MDSLSGRGKLPSGKARPDPILQKRFARPAIWRRFMSQVEMVVNGRKVSGTVEDRTLLVHYLREHLGMTGTHVGCDTSQCGACVVHLDGKAVKSCSILAVQASGSDIVTIEGLANGVDLHPVQAAFREHHGLQCGFCTPGMIMAATDMIARHPEGLDEKTVRAELEGNICRCTGYHNIVKAILAASKAMGKTGKAKTKKAA
jgi:carbon-monoxide dehydrogenase small subunit